MRHKHSAYDKALWALEKGRPAVAFRALKRLAESGEKDAYHMVGYLYDVGQGTRRNRRNAMHWYRRSYRAGCSMSAMNIATIYRDLGRPRAEFGWYERAAALGDGDALLEVAFRRLSGKGTRRSLRLAVRDLRAVLKEKHTSEWARDVAGELLRGCEVRRRTA